MNKRLRKKLRVGEFDIPLLPIAFEMKPFDTIEARNGFLDRFITEAIEAHDIQFGGGGTDLIWSGFAEPTGRSLTITDEQAEAVRFWIAAQSEIARSAVGPIMRDSEVCKLQDAGPDFPVPQEWTANPGVERSSDD